MCFSLTGEFAVQTCFEGRFGDEIGNDEFGAQVIGHARELNSGDVVMRIENTEFTYVGQAFRLGRYAIHFHLNGDMSGSYVKKVAIHKSFNRAVNIHGTHNVLVQNNVGYDIKGIEICCLCVFTSLSFKQTLYCKLLTWKKFLVLLMIKIIVL